MNDSIALILTYLRMIWRFRWAALLSGALNCGVGWLVVMMMPNQYEVTTKVFLDTRTLLRPLLKGIAIEGGVQKSTTLMMRRTLLVRPNLEAVARKTDMDLSAKTPADFDRLLEKLAKNIKVNGTSRDNIFVIGYRNPDPQLANKVVEAILNRFVEKSLGTSRKDTSKTKQFLDRQIADYEARLQAGERRLKEFKQRNVGMMPTEGQGYYERLQKLNEQLAGAKLGLSEAEQRAAALQAQLAGEEPTFGLGPPPAPVTPAAAAMVKTPFDDRVKSLQANIDQLLLKYTDKHPDVIAGRRLLAELQNKRKAYVKAHPPAPVAPARTDPGQGSPTENPVYQEIKVAHGQAQAEAAALKARVVEYQRRADELRKLVDTVPKVEAELKSLNRDYDINNKNYKELVSRRESLKIGEQAGESTDQVQFNVIEPPRVPLLPVSPDRPKLSIGVFVFGVAGGLGLALLIAMMRPGVYTRQGLEELTKLPVFGAVARIWTPRERLHRKLEIISFGFGCVLLMSGFTGIMTLELNHSDYLQRFQNIDLAAKFGALRDQYL